MKFGVLLPTRRIVMEGADPRGFDEVIGLARTAEDAALDSVWVGDSLTAKPRLEPLTALAAIASHTRRVRLGTAVLLAALRHPVHLAHQAATLDFVSGGRLVLGVGVGGAFNEAQRQEWRIAGVDARTRGSRFDEVLEIVSALTRGETVTRAGRHFHLDGAAIAPKSPQTGGVPFLVASHWRANRDSQFQRAARLGSGVISISDYPREYAKALARVDLHARALGRSPDSLERSFYMTVNLGADPSESADEADRFLKMYYGANIWGSRWGPYGPSDLTVQRIRSYQNAGASTMIVRFASFDQQTQLARFLEEVVPHLR